MVARGLSHQRGALTQWPPKADCFTLTLRARRVDWANISRQPPQDARRCKKVITVGLRRFVHLLRGLGGQRAVRYSRRA